MAFLSKILNLFRFNPKTDGSLFFNLDKAFGENFDKLENAISITNYNSEATYPKDYWVLGIVDGQKKLFTSLVDENKGNDLTDTNYWKELSLGGGMPIGKIYPMICEDGYIPDGSLPCDGTEYSAKQFSQFYQNFLKNGRLKTCSYLDYETEIGLFGQCGKFAIGSKIIPISSNSELTVSGEYTRTIEDVFTFTDGVWTANFTIEEENNGDDGSTTPSTPTISEPSPIDGTETSDETETNGIDLSSYGITVVGTPQEGDTITFEEQEFFRVPTIINRLVTSKDDIATIEYDINCLNSQLLRYPGVDSSGVISPLVVGAMSSDNTVGWGPYSSSTVTNANFGKAYFNGTGVKTIDGVSISGSWVAMNVDPNGTYIADLSKTNPTIEVRYFIVVSTGQVNENLMDWSEWNSSLTNKASKSDVDGKWVTKNVTLLDSLGTLSQVTIDLSDYLPNDGFDYEVKFKLAGYDNDSTYGYYLDTDKWITSETPIQSDEGIASPHFHIYGGTYARQTVNVLDLPVGINRFVKVTGLGADNVYLHALGYRRLGKNI